VVFNFSNKKTSLIFLSLDYKTSRQVQHIMHIIIIYSYCFSRLTHTHTHTHTHNISINVIGGVTSVRCTQYEHNNLFGLYIYVPTSLAVSKTKLQQGTRTILADRNWKPVRYTLYIYTSKNGGNIYIYA